jgi:hypothetical protein
VRNQNVSATPAEHKSQHVVVGLKGRVLSGFLNTIVLKNAQEVHQSQISTLDLASQVLEFSIIEESEVAVFSYTELEIHAASRRRRTDNIIELESLLTDLTKS